MGIGVFSFFIFNEKRQNGEEEIKGIGMRRGRILASLRYYEVQDMHT